MSNLPALFSDLALILVTAGLTTVIFKWLKQPLVLGYIIAGFLIGPYFTYFPVIIDHASVETWSEIGMVFLLFAIGLEFSFKKLKKVGGTVGITALTELVTMFVVGFVIGRLIGWTKMDCIFLGAMLSISSTTIIAKAFEDMKLGRKKFVEGVIGELVVEDLEAVLLMVILSTLSLSKSFDGQELLLNVVKLVFFLLIWFIGGIFIVPSVLKSTRKFMSEETLTVFSVGLCFLMVVLANIAGFSSALGAFVMGSILAETIEADYIHKLITPIKNLFGAIFFVSVGMMVNPQILIDYWWQILVITVVLLFFKPASNIIGRLVSGEDLKNSIQGGLCFCQIGEFSFIIATVGITYGVIDGFLYPIIISVSIITTFITPYSIKLGEPLYNRLNKRIPHTWKEKLSNKETGIKVKGGKKVEMRSFVMKQFKQLFIYLSIIIALGLICVNFINPYIVKMVHGGWGKMLSLFIVLLILSPFLWAMAFRHSLPNIKHKLLLADKFNKNVVYILFSIRYFVEFLLVLYLVRRILGINFFLCFIIALAFSLLLAFMTPVMRVYKRIEHRFLDNLNKRQTQQSFVVPEVLQDNFRLEKIAVGVDCKYVGMKLGETDFRDSFNLSVVSVERGEKVFDLPNRDFVLYPYDKVTFVGREEQLGKLRSVMETDSEMFIHERVDSDVDIYKMEIRADHPLVGIALLDSGISLNYNAMVIAIERDGAFILNPSPRVQFAEGDLVWFVSSKAAAEKMGIITKSGE